MITSNGKIRKKTYCSNCFSIIVWDNSKDQFDQGGYRKIKCPICKYIETIDATDVQILQSGGGGDDASNIVGTGKVGFMKI